MKLASFLPALAVLGLFALRARRRGVFPRWMLRALVVAGPAAVVALEAGWVTTEVGRQPWIVHEVMRVEDAVTDTGWIPVSLALASSRGGAPKALGSPAP